MTDRESLFSALTLRAQKLKDLPEGWDSHGGARIDPASADKAVELAMALAPPFPDYEPQLVPTDGTVQVEWHTHGWSVELYVENRNV